MKKLSKNLYKFLFTLTAMMALAITFVTPSSAACPPNVVPNPLDPNCQAGAGQINPGFLINRFIVFLPYIVTVLAVAAFAWGAVKIIIGGEDGKEEGLKIIRNAAIGLGLFFSIWTILFFISIITGFDILGTLGV